MSQSDIYIYFLIICKRGRESKTRILCSWESTDYFLNTWFEQGLFLNWLCMSRTNFLPQSWGSMQHSMFTVYLILFYYLKSVSGYMCVPDPAPLPRTNKPGIFPRPSLSVIFQNIWLGYLEHTKREGLLQPARISLAPIRVLFLGRKITASL